MRVIWSPEALPHIAYAYDYFAEFNPQAARKLAEALIAQGESLRHFPERGRVVRGTTMRELTAVPPYIVRYEVTRDEVRILRVRHSARQP